MRAHEPPQAVKQIVHVAFGLAFRLADGKEFLGRRFNGSRMV